MNRTKAALFVDFDNIYSGLKEVEERAAQAFATLPGQWLEWLERRPVDGISAGNGERPPRSVLIRNMYLNPRHFGRFRADFTRAGFSVMDCPSLTLQGKSSADIRMVLDMVDTLEHRTQFDEFIIFSGDADFTPLLQRLRAHDRRTAILAVGPAAQAYKSAADSLIDVDEFVEQALRMQIGGDQSRLIERHGLARGVPVGLQPGPARSANEVTDPDSDVLSRMAARVRREVEATGRVLAANLPRIFREFHEFTRSNWLGFYSLRRLVERLVQCDAYLVIEGAENEEWCVLHGAAEPVVAAARGAAVAAPPAIDAAFPEVEVAAANPTATAHPGAGGTGTLSPRDLASGTASGWVAPASLLAPTDSTGIDPVALAERMIEIVHRIVAEAARPVPLAAAAQAVADELGHIVRDSHWAGHGSFKSLLRRRLSEHLRVITDPTPGYVYDPVRHTDLFPADADEFDGQPHTLAAFAKRVFNVTGAPYLSPDDYSTLFDAISEAVKTAPFQIGTTSVIARELCGQRGCTISRQAIQFVIKGIGFGKHKLGDETVPHESLALAMAFRDNVRKLCANAQMVLSDKELALLDAWLVGSPDAETVGGAGGEPAAWTTQNVLGEHTA